MNALSAFECVAMQDENANLKLENAKLRAELAAANTLIEKYRGAEVRAWEYSGSSDYNMSRGVCNYEPKAYEYRRKLYSHEGVENV